MYSYSIFIFSVMFNASTFRLLNKFSDFSLLLSEFLPACLPVLNYQVCLLSFDC